MRKLERRTEWWEAVVWWVPKLVARKKVVEDYREDRSMVLRMGHVGCRESRQYLGL